MKIGVLLKPVVDPDDPVFKIENGVRTGDKVVISSYDENALELALKLKDINKDIEVVVITIVDRDFSQSIKKALAMGADKAIIVDNNKYRFLDSISISKILANIIKDNEINLVLTGYESADWGSRTVAPLIASFINYNFISFIYFLEIIDNNSLKIYKNFEDNEYIFDSKLPLVLSVTTHYLNVPRYPKVKDIMLASKKPQINIPIENYSNLISNYIDLYDTKQYKNEIECMIIEGKDPTEKAKMLVSKLKELKVL